MAGVFNCKNTFTQPTKVNGTSPDMESNRFDSPAKDAFDVLLAPDFGWPSYEFDHEWTYSSSEHNTERSSFVGIEATGLDSRNATSASDLHSLNHRLSPTSRRTGVVFDLLEDDFVFRVTSRSDSQYPFSSVRRGLETNLAELQVAGDVLAPHSIVFEEGWSRLSTPALSVTSEISDETSLPGLPTSSNANSTVPTAMVLTERSPTPPPAEYPVHRDLSPPTEPTNAELQVSPDECKHASSGKKRKRDSLDVDDPRDSASQAPSDLADQKWFSIEGRRKPRHGTESEVAIYTKYGESCCSHVGDAGYCQFEWRNNGRTKKCGVELIRDRDVVTAHFNLHFENLGYYSMAANNPQWRPRCPWCRKQATTFDNFLRHVNYSELELNVTRCGCGGSINRGNQSRFMARHEETKKHQEWLTRTRANEAAGLEGEPDEQQPEFVQGSSRGTKRRCSNAKVTEEAEEDVADDECDEFVEGSSTCATRKRSSWTKTKTFVKEEPDEEQEGFVQGPSAGATRKRRRAKKRKAGANEDPDEEQEEFVQGSSTGSKRRRLR